MKKQYTKKGLQQLADTLAKQVTTARSTYVVWESDQKELDSPERKKQYKAEHLAALRRQKHAENVAHLQALVHEMRRIGQPALAERKRWSKEAFIREARFAALPDNTYTEDNKMLGALSDMTDAVRRLQTTLWVGGLADEDLIEAANDAAEAGDLATLGAALAETRKRKSGLLEVKITAAVEKVELPEAAREAVDALEMIERSLQEAEAIADAIAAPLDEVAQSRRAFFNWTRTQEEAAKAKEQESTGAELPPAA